MLIVATSAPGKMGTPGGNPQRGRPDDFVDDPSGVALSDLRDLDGHLIIRGGIGDKDRLILITADAIAAEGNILDDKGDNHPLFKYGQF